MQRWQQRQLPIYYQIRFKEISTSIEDVLSNPSLLATAKPSPDPAEFSLSSTTTVFAAIQRCWAPEVFVFGLVHRFWKLTLQLLARYHSWLLSVLPEKHDHLGDFSTEKVTTSSIIFLLSVAHIFFPSLFFHPVSRPVGGIAGRCSRSQ